MPGDNRTNIIVAVISLVGVLGAAVIANWDKFFSRTTPKGAESARPLSEPKPTVPPGSNTPPSSQWPPDRTQVGPADHTGQPALGGLAPNTETNDKFPKSKPPQEMGPSNYGQRLATAFQAEFKVTNSVIMCVQFQGDTPPRYAQVRVPQVNFPRDSWVTVTDANGVPVTFATSVGVRATSLASYVATGACSGRLVVDFVNGLYLHLDQPDPTEPYNGLALRKKVPP